MGPTEKIIYDNAARGHPLAQRLQISEIDNLIKDLYLRLGTDENTLDFTFYSIKHLEDLLIAYHKSFVIEKRFLSGLK